MNEQTKGVSKVALQIRADKIKPVTITDVSNGGIGDRVCIDLAQALEPNEGLLVGNYNRGLFLINNERGPEDQDYEISPRPFRINAGCVSAYVLMPDGNMKYLCELKTGDEVLAINASGESRNIVVLRQKTEPRPMTLIRGTTDFSRKTPIKSAKNIKYFAQYHRIFDFYDHDTGEKIEEPEPHILERYMDQPLDIKIHHSTFCQTAETVSLLEATNPEEHTARFLPITEIKPKQRVYAYVKNPTLKGRHFGIEYDDYCLEI